MLFEKGKGGEVISNLAKGSFGLCEIAHPCGCTKGCRRHSAAHTPAGAPEEAPEATVLKVKRQIVSKKGSNVSDRAR